MGGAADDDMPDGSSTGKAFRFLLNPAGELETIRDEEWRREQGEDPFCSAINEALTSEKSTSFPVNEEGILVR